jgi:hypothetical protein
MQNQQQNCVSSDDRNKKEKSLENADSVVCDEERVWCKICNKEYKNKNTLNSHTFTMHCNAKGTL